MSELLASLYAERVAIIAVIAATAALSTLWRLLRRRAHRIRSTRMSDLRGLVQQMRQASVSTDPVERRRVAGIVGLLRRRCENWGMTLQDACTNEGEISRRMGMIDARPQRPLPLDHAHISPRPSSSRMPMAPISERMIELEEHPPSTIPSRDAPRHAAPDLPDPAVTVIPPTSGGWSDHADHGCADLGIEVVIGSDDSEEYLVVEDDEVTPEREDAPASGDEVDKAIANLDAAFAEYEAADEPSPPTERSATDRADQDDFGRTVERWFDEIMTEKAL